jgi:hypothetical protein
MGATKAGGKDGEKDKENRKENRIELQPGMEHVSAR